MSAEISKEALAAADHAASAARAARAARTTRSAHALPTRAARRRYVITMIVLGALALAILGITMGWENPLPIGTRGFWMIARVRSEAIAVIATVAVAQALATVAFQTVTNNRILTPSIIGFESMYQLIQTTAVFVLGVAGATAAGGTGQFVGQIVVMVLFATVLYGLLLTGRRGNLHVTLLVGIVLGGGMRAASTFLQRLLDPAEFDVLLARQIGSIANSDVSKLAIAVPIVAVVAVVMFALAGKLNVLALGRETAINLGVDHRRLTIGVLILVSVLVSVSTALIGPMTFFGFLVAMLTYQLAETFDHRLLFPMAALTGFVVFAGAHLILKRVFYAEGSVGIIIELVGGAFFLVYILRKGRLS